MDNVENCDSSIDWASNCNFKANFSEMSENRQIIQMLQRSAGVHTSASNMTGARFPLVRVDISRDRHDTAGLSLVVTKPLGFRIRPLSYVCRSIHFFGLKTAGKWIWSPIFFYCLGVECVKPYCIFLLHLHVKALRPANVFILILNIIRYDSITPVCTTSRSSVRWEGAVNKSHALARGHYRLPAYWGHKFTEPELLFHFRKVQDSNFSRDLLSWTQIVYQFYIWPLSCRLIYC